MRNVLKKIILNVNKAEFSTIAAVVQESDITLNLELYKDSKALELKGQTIELKSEKYTQAIASVASGNLLTIELKNQFLSRSGKLNLELNIKDDKGQFNTARFSLDVTKSVAGTETIEASNVNSALEEKINEIENKADLAITDISNKVTVAVYDKADEILQNLKINEFDKLDKYLYKSNIGVFGKEFNTLDERLKNDFETLLSVDDKIDFIDYEINKHILINATISAKTKNTMIKGKSVKDNGVIQSAGEKEGKIIVETMNKNMCQGMEYGGLDGRTGAEVNGVDNIIRNKGFIKCEAQSNYIISFSLDLYSSLIVCFYDRNKNFISSLTPGRNYFSAPNSSEYVRFRSRKNDSTTITKEEIDNVKAQLEQGTKESEYVYNESYSKEISIPYAKGLKGYANVSDKIKDKQIIKNVDFIILNGVESWYYNESQSAGNTAYFQSNVLYNKTVYPSVNQVLCDKLESSSLWNKDIEGIAIEGTANSGDFLRIRINKTKLSSLDEAGIKQLLKTNPITVYYEMKESVVYDIENDSEVETYKDKTHIRCNNDISVDISTKVASLTSELISNLITENSNLIKDRKELEKTNLIIKDEVEELRKSVDSINYFFEKVVISEEFKNLF